MTRFQAFYQSPLHREMLTRAFFLHGGFDPDQLAIIQTDDTGELPFCNLIVRNITTDQTLRIIKQRPGDQHPTITFTPGIGLKTINVHSLVPAALWWLADLKDGDISGTAPTAPPEDDDEPLGVGSKL